MRSGPASLAVMIVFALLTMVVYRFGGGGRAGSQDATGRGGSFVLGYWVRNWFYWFIRPVIRMSLATNLGPLFFNLAAVACGVASMVFFARGQLAAAGWCILLSGFADVMDGEIARGRGVTSSSGAFLDSTLDRFSELAVFVGLAAFLQSGSAVILVLVALGGSLLVSYTRARGESLGITCKAGLMQRAERLLLLGFGAILDPALSAVFGREPGFILQILIVIIAVGTVATAIYRTIWISRRLLEE
ncbi:MAG: CDP-alcohol phosphatidyltransferase family protein [Candidatus Krumholzibacteriia bacterium]